MGIKSGVSVLYTISRVWGFRYRSVVFENLSGSPALPTITEMEDTMIEKWIVEDFLGSLTETQGYVEGEWDEYEALLVALAEGDE